MPVGLNLSGLNTGAISPLVTAADVRADDAEAPSAENSRHKYEFSPRDRTVLNGLVNRYMGGEHRIFDSDYDYTNEAVTADRCKHRDKRNALTKGSTTFFENVSKEGKAADRSWGLTPPSIGKLTGDSLNCQFVSLLDQLPGLVVGEVHGEVGARKLLIDNMQALKDRGVSRLYMEHLLTDLHGEELDRLHESPHNQISDTLMRYLRTVMCQPGNADPEMKKKYSFVALVEAAHRAGIRVVPIDCAASYFLDGQRWDVRQCADMRIQLMNYYAYLVMSEDIRRVSSESDGRQDQKWIALVGNTHTNFFDGVPGLAELFGVPGVRVNEATVNRLTRDVGDEHLHPFKRVGPVTVKGDFLIEVDVRPSLVPKLMDRMLAHLSCCPRRH